MLGYLRKATAAQVRSIGPFIDDTDFKTAKTALTIANTDVKLSANGGASANKNSGGGTHLVNGVYSLTFDATDTAAAGELFVSIKVASGLAVFGTYHVLEAAIYDALLATSANAFSGAAGSTTLTALAANAIAAANIASAAFTAAKFATDAIDANALAANAASEIGTATWATAARTLTANTNLNDLNAAGIRAAVGLASANLDTQLGTLATASNLATVAGYIDTEVASILTIANKLDTALELDGAVYRFTTNALEQAPAGGTGLDAAGVRAAIGLASANLDTQLATIDGRIDTEIGTLLTNTSAASIRSAVGLASANLDTQLSAIAGFIDTEIASIISSIAALNNLSAATVKAQVVAALATDTYAEPSGVPAATASLVDKIRFLAALSRNKLTQTSTTQLLRNDGDSGTIATSTIADDGTTFTRGKFA